MLKHFLSWTLYGSVEYLILFLMTPVTSVGETQQNGGGC